MPDFNVGSVLDLFRSFIPGPRLIDGTDLVNLANFDFGYQNGLTAHSGGGTTGAIQFTPFLNVVTTVGTTADSGALPVALPGSSCVIQNDSANSMTIYGIANQYNGGLFDSIASNGSTVYAAGTAGLALASGKIAIFYCGTIGKWKELLTA